jgi:hypothetical protein
MAGVGAGAVLWNEWQVDRDFHAVWLLLSRAKAKAINSGVGPVMVRFNGHKAIVEDRRGTVIESLKLPTLDEVRYKTTRGDRMIVFSNGGGRPAPTTSMNTVVILSSGPGQATAARSGCIAQAG